MSTDAWIVTGRRTALLFIVFLSLSSCVPPTPPTKQTFTELNFEWTPPRGYRINNDPAVQNPDASVIANRIDDTWFMIIAERDPDVANWTTDALTQLAEDNMRAASTRVKIIEKEPRTFAGINGVRMISIAEIDGIRIRYVHHIAVHNGFMYQLMAWAPASRGTKLEAEANNLVNGFVLLDPSLQLTADMVSASGRDDPSFGFNLDLTTDEWVKWDGMPTDFPEAEYGALHKDHGAIAIVPVRLGAHDVDPEQAAISMIRMLEFELDDPGLSDFESIEHHGLPGVRAMAWRSFGADETYEYRFDTVVADDAAWLIAVWWLVGQDVLARPALFKTADAVTLQNPTQELTKDQMTEPQLRRHRVFFENIGDHEATMGRSASASRWRKLAKRYR